VRSLLLAVLLASTAAGPPLATPQDVMDKALVCPASFTDTARDPILLVHGTATSAADSWTWGYMKVLTAEG
jgi:triacylglycerol lipase